uniref:Recep_L_domain domain-containing protein n=1 Tax=Haemonchus contortus TaxID=6289 RepID=A0A7I4YVG5_HAECO
MRVLLIFWAVGSVLGGSNRKRVAMDRREDDSDSDDDRDRKADTCSGGSVDHDFMEYFLKRTCTIISGNLHLKDLDGSQGLEELSRIRKISGGALIFEDNYGIKSISFLKNLEEIDNSQAETPALFISNNIGFETIGLPSLRQIVSAGYGPIIEIYSLSEISKKDENRLRNLVGERYEIHYHILPVEQEDHNTILKRICRCRKMGGEENEKIHAVVIIITTGVATLAILAVVIVFMIYWKEMSRKKEEMKAPELAVTEEIKEIPSRAPPGSAELTTSN